MCTNTSKRNGSERHNGNGDDDDARCAGGDDRAARTTLTMSEKSHRNQHLKLRAMIKSPHFRSFSLVFVRVDRLPGQCGSIRPCRRTFSFAIISRRTLLFALPCSNESSDPFFRSSRIFISADNNNSVSICHPSFDCCH